MKAGRRSKQEIAELAGAGEWGFMGFGVTPIVRGLARKIAVCVQLIVRTYNPAHEKDSDRLDPGLCAGQHARSRRQYIQARGDRRIILFKEVWL